MFFSEIFWCDHFQSLYLICYNIASVFYFVFGMQILAPQPGIKSAPPTLEGKKSASMIDKGLERASRKEEMGWLKNTN